MDLRYDFSEEYKEFEKSYDKLDEIINFSLRDGLYLNLIIIDMTYLNSKFGQEPGNRLKTMILSFLENYKKENKILHYTFVSSKLFFFTKNKLDFKEKIDELSLCIKEKYNYGDKKIIYIIDKDIYLNKYFHIESLISSNLENDFKHLFLLALKDENNINDLRVHFSKYIEKIASIDGLMTEKDKNEIDLFWNSLSFMQKRSASIPNEDINNFDYLIRTSDFENKIKNSKYLTNSLKIYTNYKNSGHDLTFGLCELEKYLIWLKMQEMLVFSYKIEKVYLFFNRKNKYGTEDSLENITSFNDKEALKAWFKNSVRIFEPVFTPKQREIVNNIRENIENVDFQNLDSLVKLRDKIVNLFDNFHMKGIFSIPLEKIAPPESAKAFFTEQFYVHFGSEYKIKFLEWCKKDFVRLGFYSVVNKPKQLYEANLFLNEDIYEHSKINNINVKYHLAFLEIDGFNSLNNIYFPNDSDSIVYGKILELLYNLIEKIFSTKLNLFKTILISIMGDEFFFSFLTIGNISEEDKVDILDFLEEFRSLIVDEFKHISFPKSSKVKVELKNGAEISFRNVLYKKGFIGFGKELTMEISKIGITGGVMFNLNNKTQETFNEYIDSLDSYMNQVGKVKNIGKIIEIKLSEIN